MRERERHRERGRSSPSRPLHARGGVCMRECVRVWFVCESVCGVCVRESVCVGGVRDSVCACVVCGV